MSLKQQIPTWNRAAIVCFTAGLVAVIVFVLSKRPTPKYSLTMQINLQTATAANTHGFEALGRQPSCLVTINVTKDSTIALKCRQLTTEKSGTALRRMVLYTESMRLDECVSILSTLLTSSGSPGAEKTDQFAHRLEQVRSGQTDPCQQAQLAFPVIGISPAIECTLRCDHQTGKLFLIIEAQYGQP